MVEEAADEPDEIEYDPEANSITLTLNGTIVSVDIEIQVHARLASSTYNIRRLYSPSINLGMEMARNTKCCCVASERRSV